MSEIKLIVFDMAGTTVRDENEVLHCFFEAANQTGLVADAEKVNAMMGLPCTSEKTTQSRPAAFFTVSTTGVVNNPGSVTRRGFFTFSPSSTWASSCRQPGP